ncbi:MAG: enoyl-CoA hydratase [Parcubacteria group bacterium Gr01-1014_48]|nr:MAG: enoyl-CoA hydratase [Parcubacteria group bacterium Greene0416_14]TSC73495.1 MAG: enoyl-CoA hydratase [Parcubacteria group bacterium Gr01-1014_48]TSD01228.1 MAG: enoyl-CoA hydratase [Parcubacteria group bacterium Greene1014_15]TSD08307.1 MAG: enoyl-CoA hydratase [Parcubacteria group bacterium Greene0714_4]
MWVCVHCSNKGFPEGELCMEYKNILFEEIGGVALITLNRPKAFNTFNGALADELLDAVVTCSSTDSIRAVVLTGAGKCFCAGGDVKEFSDNMDQIGAHLTRLTGVIHSAILRLQGMPKLVITAVNGMAAGGGMSLALAGDLVYAHASARFTMAYTNIGASPDGGASFMLPRLVGLRRAFELVVENPILSTEQAKQWGLINDVISGSETDFREEILRRASVLASGPTQAYARVKQLLYRSYGKTLESQLRYEAMCIIECSYTKDFKEGLAAFAEKRSPVFIGS